MEQPCYTPIHFYPLLCHTISDFHLIFVHDVSFGSLSKVKRKLSRYGPGEVLGVPGG
jgi:hypothetical protein